jgi:predicted anti-sigma-YlaC factor YlaD
MDCVTARLLIEAFNDGELDACGSIALAEHLVGCRTCAWRADAARRLKDFCREKRPHDRCPEGLKRRLAELLRRSPRGGGPPSLLV